MYRPVAVNKKFKNFFIVTKFSILLKSSYIFKFFRFQRIIHEIKNLTDQVYSIKFISCSNLPLSIKESANLYFLHFRIMFSVLNFAFHVQEDFYIVHDHMTILTFFVFLFFIKNFISFMSILMLIVFFFFRKILILFTRLFFFFFWGLSLVFDNILLTFV